MTSTFATPALYAALPPANRGNLLLVFNLVLALSRRSGRCTAGQTYLGDRCALAARTVRRCERILERLGLVRVHRHGRGNRRELEVDHARLEELTGKRSTPQASGFFATESPDTSRRTAGNRVEGSRAHSSPGEKTRNDREGARPHFAASREPRQLALFPGGSTPVGRAALELARDAGVWTSRWADAVRLALGIERERGTRRTLSWLSWLGWHNAKRFGELARRGAATFGALLHAAGEVPASASASRAGPRRLGDLLPLALGGL